MVLIFAQRVHQVCLSVPESALPCLSVSCQSNNQSINLLFAGATGARTHLDRPIPVPVPVLVHTLGTLHCNCDPSVPYLPTTYLGTVPIVPFTVHVTFPCSRSRTRFSFSRLSFLQQGLVVQFCTCPPTPPSSSRWMALGHMH